MMTKDNERVVIAAARHHLRSGNVTMARLILTHLKERSLTADFWAAWALLCLHRECGEVDEGFNSACMAVQMNPTSALAHLSLAKAHHARADSDAACVAAERSLVLDPTENEAALLLAEIHLGLGDDRRALTILATLAQRPEASEELLTLASELMLNSGADEVQQAMGWLTRSISLASYKAQARALKAMAHIVEKDLSAARNELQLALALHPDHPEILYQLVRLATMEASEVEVIEAISCARRAVALAPGHWRVRLAWSDLLRRRGQYSDAFKLLTDALEIEPGAPELWLSLARQAALLGKSSVASEALNSARDARAHSPLLAAVSREVDLLLGNWKEALKYDEDGPLKQAVTSTEPQGEMDLAQSEIHVHVYSVRDLLTNARFLQGVKQLCKKVTLCMHRDTRGMASIVQGVDVLNVEESIADPAYVHLDIKRLPVLLIDRLDSLPPVACIGAPARAVSGMSSRRKQHQGPLWFVGQGLDHMLAELVTSARESNACLVTLGKTAAFLRGFEPPLKDERIIEVDDWEGVCAAMQLADAVIVADDTLACLAGAQGVDAHVILTGLFDPQWGWDAQRSLWYPSLALHRRPNSDSPSVWQAISTALASPRRAEREPVTRPSHG
jgi:tetratricopeptide (TPR) repeat protein